MKTIFKLIVLLFFVLTTNAVQSQNITIGQSDYLRFTGGYGDANDGKVANSHFAPGLNIVGINSDNTIRKVSIWGQITQENNQGVNTFNGHSVFNYNAYINGQTIIGTGPESYFRAGAYLTMGHTTQGYFPYISFNAVLTSSSLSAPGNYFSPVYPYGSGLVMMTDAGRSALKFYQKDYDGTGNAFNLHALDPVMFLNEKGQLGIGMPYNNDLGAGYKLAVKGNILANRLKISQTGPWPDYVFDKSYQLTSLDSLETFISKNKHLPDVPSANDVIDKGIDLGDNQAVLLKKIEELTLYILQLKSQNQKQQEQIDEQQKMLINIKDKILLKP